MFGKKGKTESRLNKNRERMANEKERRKTRRHKRIEI